jgi:hypothetical protein
MVVSVRFFLPFTQLRVIECAQIGLETLGVMRPHWHSASPPLQCKLILLFILSLAQKSPETTLASPSAAFNSELEYARSVHALLPCFDGPFDILSSKGLLSDPRLPPTSGPGITTFPKPNEKAHTILVLSPRSLFQKSHRHTPRYWYQHWTLSLRSRHTRRPTDILVANSPSGLTLAPPPPIMSRLNSSASTEPPVSAMYETPEGTPSGSVISLN